MLGIEEQQEKKRKVVNEERKKEKKNKGKGKSFVIRIKILYIVDVYFLLE